MIDGSLDYDRSQEDHISISIITLDRLLKAKMIGLIDLYVFYLKTAKWQKTNKTKCNDIYVRALLDLGSKRLYSLKAKLKDLGLIEVCKIQSDKGHFSGSYIKVNYIHTPLYRTPVEPSSGKEQQVLYTGKEVLYTGKESNIGDFCLEDDKLFETFWNAHPKRNDKRSGKQPTKKKFIKLSKPDQEQCCINAKNYNLHCETTGQIARDPVRFFKDDFWKEWEEAPESNPSSEPKASSTLSKVTHPLLGDIELEQGDE